MDKIRVSLIIVLSLFLFSCSPYKEKIDENALKTVGEYFALLDSNEHEQAFEKINPSLREQTSFDRFLKDLKSGEELYGKITAIKIQEEVKYIDDNEYVFTVIVATPSKYIVQEMKVVEIDNKWYMDEIKPMGYQDREKPHLE